MGSLQEVAIPAPKVRCGVPASAYVAFRRNGGFPPTTFQCEMRFTGAFWSMSHGLPPARAHPRGVSELVSAPTPNSFPPPTLTPHRANLIMCLWWLLDGKVVADFVYPLPPLSCPALDCDPDSGEPDGGDGVEDVFPLEAFEVSASDFMAKVAVPNFRTAWEVRKHAPRKSAILLGCCPAAVHVHCSPRSMATMGGSCRALHEVCVVSACILSSLSPLSLYFVTRCVPVALVVPIPAQGMSPEGEVVESFALSFKTVSDAVTAVLDFLGMAACDGTGVVKEGANKHNGYLSGVFLGGIRVLARVALVIEDPASGCILKIAVRSEDPDISRLVADCIH